MWDWEVIYCPHVILNVRVDGGEIKCMVLKCVIVQTSAMGWHGESLFTFFTDYFSYFSERVSKANSERVSKAKSKQGTGCRRFEE